MLSAPTATRSRRPGLRKSYDVVCADCRRPTTVPFRPAPDRPVYCRPCFTDRRDEPAVADRKTERDSSTASHVFTDIPINDATRAAIARMDITEPTAIQSGAIPHLQDRRDLIGQARTGSGKTLAFAVPMVERCDRAVRKVQGLVLVPTRELAIQVAGVIEELASPHRLRVTLLYGGRSLRPEYTALDRGAHIVIGTPGRTLDHLRQGTLSLRSVRFLVLDEADEMLDRGFARDVEAILSGTPSERQTALFSATMPEWVAKTAKSHLHNPRKRGSGCRSADPPVGASPDLLDSQREQDRRAPNAAGRARRRSGDRFRPDQARREEARKTARRYGVSCWGTPGQP